MSQKNYANLVRIIFGEKAVLSDDESLNANKQLAETVEQVMNESFAPSSMEALAINNFILEGKNSDDFVRYVQDNAEALARQYMAKAIRKLRHPRQSRQLRPFVELDSGEND